MDGVIHPWGWMTTSSPTTSPYPPKGRKWLLKTCLYLDVSTDQVNGVYEQSWCQKKSCRQRRPGFTMFVMLLGPMFIFYYVPPSSIGWQKFSQGNVECGFSYSPTTSLSKKTNSSFQRNIDYEILWEPRNLVHCFLSILGEKNALMDLEIGSKDQGLSKKEDDV